MSLDAKTIINAVVGVTKRWARQRISEERRASSEARRREALTRSGRQERVTLQDAVLKVMRDGIAKASGDGRYIFPGRNLYYSVRDLVQAHTLKALTQQYFDQIVKVWEKEHGPIAGMYRDPRGYFVEPHTGQVVPLGTREVEAYSIPPWRYDKILYVEKKGFHEIFRAAKLAERYDLGIICAEGYATNAAKLLLARAEQSAMTIFCLHDADPYGYNIGRKLREATRLGKDIQVIDMGLSLKDALALGLTPEVFIRKNALPQGLILNELERKYFEGVKHGWHGGRPTFRCQRVELNALAADPDRFIRYVEDKLQEHGCGKLVPPKKVVTQTARAALTSLLESVAMQEILKAIGVEKVIAELVEKYGDRVTVKDLHSVLTEWGKGREPDSWTSHLEKELLKRVQAIASEVSEGAAAKARAMVRTPDEGDVQ
jgi:hypothetical protein